ncbi:MAG: ATP-grasp domain-containing protein [Deltaproteobacteria bacterium]|nr:ATP-grasp domain-containing protein [Deltaproteobacteria bacterium]
MGNITDKKGIIILGAGVMQIPAILKAKELGLFVIASDKSPNAPGFRYADYALTLDIKNASGHVEFAKANKEMFNISGVLAGADVAITAAKIAVALGLPGIPVEVAERSNNKWLMKQKWLSDGIATPYAEEVSTLGEARIAVKKVGLPCMVKAIDNAASRGSRRIDSEAELEAALIDAKNHSTTKTALIEEFVEGNEQSVEFVVHNGTHHRFGIVDRHFGFEPFPIEVGHTNPSKLSKEIQEELYSLVVKAAASLGIEFGPYKADTILTKKGPMILELPARLSGGFHSQYTTPLATGLEPQKAALALAVGMNIPEQAITQTHSKVTVCKAVFPAPGRVVSISGVDEAKTLKGVNEIFLMVKPGDIIEEYKNCAHRVCYIIATGSDFNEAEENWASAGNTVKIETIREEELADAVAL